MTIWEFISNNFDTIVLTIAGLVASLVYKGKADKDDAVASIKTGVAEFLRSNPEIKTALVDGKVSKDEWMTIFKSVGPEALRVATKGGSKILRRWIDKESVANKYIEAVTRELAVEFADPADLNKDGVVSDEEKAEYDSKNPKS